MGMYLSPARTRMMAALASGAHGISASGIGASARLCAAPCERSRHLNTEPPSDATMKLLLKRPSLLKEMAVPPTTSSLSALRRPRSRTRRSARGGTSRNLRCGAVGSSDVRASPTSSDRSARMRTLG